MPENDPTTSGFSTGRRWLATLNLLVGSVALLALLVMVNYLAQGHFKRLPLADAVHFKLSQQTQAVLNSLTNDVRVTIFYKRQADVYAMVTALLQEYQNANPAHVHVVSLDYDRSPGLAAQLLARLHLGANQKDFVAFECGDQHKICFDNKLSTWDFRDLLRSREVHRNNFLGELYFTSDIFAVSHPGSLKACFLTGHGERDPGDTNGPHADYTKLAGILKDEISCDWTNLTLSETDGVPADCSLLIVASGIRCPNPLTTNELAQIQTYLQHNGRMLALLDVTEGLDPVLSNWNIVLGTNHILDTTGRNWFGQGEFKVWPVADTNSASLIHPIMKLLVREGFPVKMFAPHPIYPSIKGAGDPGGAAFSRVAATSNGTPLATEVNPGNATPQPYTLIAAVEKNVITEHGGTRIVVAGDSDFLDDQMIDSGGGDNHDFASQTLDWLLQRPEMLAANISPHAIKEYTVSLTETQTTQVRWLFLGAMPGSILLLGGLVWLRRRS